MEDLSKIPLTTFVGSNPPEPLAQSLQPISSEALGTFHDAVVARGAVSVLLAAGKGSRFKSSYPKVIHPFAGRPLAQHALDAAERSALPVIVIVGHAKETVVNALRFRKDETVFIFQDEQMGTAHAVYLAKCALPECFRGDVIVSYADNPGVDAELIKEVMSTHAKNKDAYGDSYAAMILTGSRKHAGQGANAYGRIVRKGRTSGPIIDIVEKKTISKLAMDKRCKFYGDEEWTPEQLDDVDEFNSGIVIAQSDQYYTVLGEVLASQTKFDPPKYEYYATDFVKGLVAKQKVCEGFQVEAHSMWKLEGANTVEELEELERTYANRMGLNERSE
ncbi:UDP-N-acetylglucosamine pyrophosphorylase [Gracilaria domingensis]|nr:UDP-N-acetylglucosamine pyrophosphorylase [Gracilaria domingensis]